MAQILELLLGILTFLIISLLLSMKIIRPTHKALVERMGKYNRSSGGDSACTGETSPEEEAIAAYMTSTEKKGKTK